MPRKKASANRRNSAVHNKSTETKQKKGSNTLRIIGGEWRSRKLTFIDALGLRPTPDRVRETLFNWLQKNIYNARCIDLFAGSGALGFEALSRGAKEVVFVEKNPDCAKQLNSNLNILKNDAQVIQSDALSFLEHYCLKRDEQTHSQTNRENSFDIVFLDPPYRQGLIEKSLHYLQQENLIHEDTLIYLEHESEESFDWQSFNLEILKQTNAGQVQSFLLQPID